MATTPIDPDLITPAELQALAKTYADMSRVVETKLHTAALRLDALLKENHKVRAQICPEWLGKVHERIEVLEKALTHVVEKTSQIGATVDRWGQPMRGHDACANLNKIGSPL